MILGALLLASTFFSFGPHGGRIAALAAAPSDARVIYAGTQAGVLRSNDAGTTWLRTGAGIENVTLLAVDPADANTVYAVMTVDEWNGRVFKSVDAGATWTQLPLPSGVSPVALSVPEHDLIYVGSECQQFFSRGPQVQFHEAAGVFRSTDGGATWTKSEGETPQTPQCVNALAVDPLRPSHLTTRSIFNNVAQESLDGGLTWRAATADTPSSRIVAHPADPNLRYGITGGGFAGGPLFAVSHDAGMTWTRIEPANVLGDYLALEIDPSTGRLFLGTTHGAFRSGDGGRSWLPIGGLPPARVEDLVVDPSTRRLIAGTTFGLYASDFAYATSARLPVADSATTITRVVVQPGDPRRLFATSSVSITASPTRGRIHRSTDGGLSWTTIEDPNPEARPLIAVDAAGDLFAAPRTLTPSLYRLPRDGNAFERLPQTFPSSIVDIVADPVRPGVVYVLTFVNGVYETRDSGATWQRVNWGGASTQSLAIDPANPDILYGVVSGGAYKVIEEVPFGLNAPNISGPIVVSPVRPSTLYALFETVPFSGKHLVGRSDNAGERWQITTTPSPDDTILAIAADPRDAMTVWISTGKRGLLVSRDGGNSWLDANANLPTRLIFSIAFDDQGRAMHVGTNRGVWTMPLVLGRRRAAGK